MLLLMVAWTEYGVVTECGVVINKVDETSR
jgi:hypothetical protein